eukprot:GFYU01009858.1.p1 GENE.GFYU01009858.1~~GFYU01009858.1.p1  ORF type:complete len:131 (+),score=38.84 GFYU01009858.1:353-745(+)
MDTGPSPNHKEAKVSASKSSKSAAQTTTSKKKSTSATNSAAAAAAPRKKKTPTSSTKKTKRDYTMIDFNKLELSTLKRYRRQKKLDARPNSSKGELVVAVKAHFIQADVSELETISTFVRTLKSSKSSKD